MNTNIMTLQKMLGFTGEDVDGIRGVVTTASILAAADQGRLSVVPAPASSEPPWITELKKVFGLHEVRDNAKLASWLKLDGRTLGDPSKLPWCGDAVETAIRLALPNERFENAALASNPYWARNWENFGVPGEAFGSVATFVRDGGGHVGFLVGYDDNNYHVFGGNQGNMVGVVLIDKDRCTSRRMPKTFMGVSRPLPRLSPAGVPKSVNEF